ncbi:D-alanine--D-alanine ligase [Georgenia sp. TF02-10]|uniref:D-alanine--D-alanine ligase family protein n=1 Tax=Georgenia sp. TF02-10 TaxID=2917725 RepID=UPI001FA7BEC7|nr:D-alanine--D-alanine ligase family protein [Georgenia sp. TF02-10]UNX53868.1 D-alanine--D-alanine ligase [Georgenia sp. TF02-10]
MSTDPGPAAQEGASARPAPAAPPTATAPPASAPVSPAAAPTGATAAGAPRRVRVAVVFGGRSGEHSVSCATAASVLSAIDRDTYDVVPVGVTRAGEWVLAPDDPAALAGGRAEVSPAGPRILLAPGQGTTPLVLDGTGDGAQPTNDAAPAGAEPAPVELGPVDVVLPLLHGPYGEDGTLQGLLEMTGARYVGSGVLASAAAMDKHYMKVILAGHGLPVGPYTVITPRLWRTDKARALDAVASLDFPVFVKPARGGSSLGISRVERLADVEAAVVAAQQHDPKVIVEAGVAGREVECGVLGGPDDAEPRTSVPGEIILTAPATGFYDYDTKYLDTDPLTISVPAELPPEATDRVRELAAAAFTALGCEGLARVDFFYSRPGEVIINEVNTMPGFTPFSMYPLVWERSGLSYPELIDELIRLALARPAGLR